MKKAYKTTINWHIVNTRAKDKNIPAPNSTIIYVSVKDGNSPMFEIGTICKEGQCVYIMYNGMIKLPIENGLKWCYVDELEIIEN